VTVATMTLSEPEKQEAFVTYTRLHPDEFDIDTDLIRRLLAAQFPQWAGLPVAPSPLAGTDNAIYRVGEQLAARLPRLERSVAQVDKEHEWLPRLGPSLPLAVPVPLAKGAPGEGYPWPWAVVPWFDAVPATRDNLTDLSAAATDLGRFLTALRAIDPSGGPVPGEHNFGRGVPLAERDQATRDAIAALAGMLDQRAATQAWEAALGAEVLTGPAVWIHGDLLPGNVLVSQGRVKAVIDFGGLGVGDPACDLMIAWALFSGDSRQAFRAAVAVDDATWARGRGWALSWALIYIPYYLDTNPAGVKDAWHVVAEVLADAGA
jgi:aminoglycoside phosphotransferase (APT) family kinase protein